jgi:hypothetical protein
VFQFTDAKPKNNPAPAGEPAWSGHLHIPQHQRNCFIGKVRSNSMHLAECRPDAALQMLLGQNAFGKRHSDRGTNMRRGFLIAASLSLVAGTCASPAWAGWGCGSQLYPGGHFRTYGFATKKEAGAAMLRLCGTLHRDCRITGCRENIDTQEQANAVWPLTATNQVHCGGETGTKC